MSRFAWMDDALCAQTDPDAFHPDGPGHGYRTAAKICDTCPVRKDCEEHVERLEGAGSRADRHGMWAGAVPRARARQAETTAKEQRDALIIRLHNRGGMTAQEIAAAAGCDERTVYRVTAPHRDQAAA
ncbi:WhiB family transcriptional regulator [Streptomyces lydicus]|uniref:WhiB family transcriptional regulator n=1 Tax=Streptomyces lydicus TaxID=47763 RepID=UPI001F50B646|nr:WhiB family transcriptional regulator [Streptomyces lydicus]